MSTDPRAPKGNFSVDISEEAIEEALRAVERLEEECAGGVEIAVEEEDAPTPAAASPIRARAPKTAAEEGSELEVLRVENEQLREALSRLQADLEALRRRAQRDKEEAERYGIEKLLYELIPVLDNLERAQFHAAQGEEGLLEGVQMTHRMFQDALARFGVESFSAVGKPFDPALHEAVELRPTAEHPPNVVVEEMVRGYRLHDRLIRPAMVCVAAPPTEEAAE